MPTNAEVREQLTGPGGAFEVITDVVDGVEMKVYKDRLGSLRSVAELAAMRGDADLPRLRRPTDRLRHVLPAREQRVGRRCGTTSASPTVTVSPSCRPTTPSGASASGPPSTSAASSSASTAGGRPTRSSTACRTPAPGSWSPTKDGSRASPTTSTSCPTSRRCSSSTPTPPTSAATPVCADSTS